MCTVRVELKRERKEERKKSFNEKKREKKTRNMLFMYIVKTNIDGVHVDNV